MSFFAFPTSIYLSMSANVAQESHDYDLCGSVGQQVLPELLLN